MAETPVELLSPEVGMAAFGTLASMAAIGPQQSPALWRRYLVPALVPARASWCRPTAQAGMTPRLPDTLRPLRIA